MTQEEQQIKILRLNTGEDIIATCVMNEDNGFVTVGNPMKVIVRRISESGQSMLVMLPWLPLELIEEDLATINYEDIITTVSPKASFVEYYYDTVEHYHALLEKKEQEGGLEFGEDEEDDLFDDDQIDMEDDTIQELMKMLGDKKKQSIH